MSASRTAYRVPRTAYRVPRTAFLFLDECFYPPLDLAALTGVMVRAEQYVQVRDARCRIVRDILPEADGKIPPAIEIHASRLLESVVPAGADGDEARLGVLEKIVDVVNNSSLQIYRATCLNRRESANNLTWDPKLYGKTFFEIQELLAGALRDTLVFPIMDGVPSSLPKQEATNH